MSLLNLCTVSFEYSSGPALFEDVSFSVDPSDRIAIVGPNGAGKSTLLRIITGELSPVRGHVVRQRPLAIAAAAQELPHSVDPSLFDFVFGALASLAPLRASIERLERRLPDPACAAEYAERIGEYEELGGFQAEADVSKILGGLGYSEHDFERSISTLSGGERTRAALARALSMEADILVLDEPTNHLDIAARRWLESHLRSRAAACVLTSHDRALLSAFANRIIEIERGKVRLFEGSYQEYRQARALLDRQAWQAYDAFERRRAAVEQAAERRARLAVKVATTPEGIRGGKDYYGRRAAKVARTGRILRERINDESRVEKPWEEQPIDRLSFDRVTRSGDVILAASGLSKSYGGRTLFRDLDLALRRSERLVIAGPNGSGKTTLLNILQGIERPDSGFVRIGANVQLACIAQIPTGLDLNLTPLEICGTDTNARTLLACLKLRPDRLNSPLSMLSGGERTKVALARILNSGANLLLLDEPTNHLEIEAQEALEQALLRYPGTLILISHDRTFLDALGSDVTRLELGV